MNMQIQKADNWCWAAVATSVALTYAPQSGWTQCVLASQVLGKACCPDNPDCDEAFYLERALARVNCFTPPIAGRVPFNQIVNELGDRKRIVCARVEWFGGGAHFVAIDWYDGPRGLIRVRDPKFVSRVCHISEFADSYLNRGRWTHSYRT